MRQRLHRPPTGSALSRCGATLKQRNGYGLDELVSRSLESGSVAPMSGGDENNTIVNKALGEATGKKEKKRPKNDVSDRDVIVLGSGNLGLIYLMVERRRLTLEELNERHPRCRNAPGFVDSRTETTHPRYL